MKILPFQALICPIEGTPLHQEGSSWQCQKGHHFDIAKQGYIHLLPVQNKRSLNPGDSKAMVAARRRFLELDLYAPLAKRLNSLVLKHLDPHSTLSCLDAGCGEGYYLHHLAQDLHSKGTLELVGLDISKWAVLEASKKQKDIRWIVGSNANLPIYDQTLDWVFSIFGFPVFSEFIRVLKPKGRLLLLHAGAHHLKELRQIIYPTLKPAKEKRSQTPQGFTKLEEHPLCYTLELSSQEQISDLLAMTPHLYRASAEGKAKAAALTQIRVTVDVLFEIYESVPVLP